MHCSLLVNGGQLHVSLARDKSLSLTGAGMAMGVVDFFNV